MPKRGEEYATRASKVTVELIDSEKVQVLGDSQGPVLMKVGSCNSHIAIDLGGMNTNQQSDVNYEISQVSNLLVFICENFEAGKFYGKRHNIQLPHFQMR